MDPDRLGDIARKWGTPTYVYAEDLIRKRCRLLQSLFPDLPVSWLFAVKANDNPHILQIIAGEGMGFDTVSYEEVLLCRKLGIRPEDIFYTENNMTDAEMKGAVKQEVFLNIGSIDRLKAFCQTYPGLSCSIRIKPDIGDGHHVKVDTGNRDSKFGIRMDRISEAISMANTHQVTIRGIHAHIGSGIKEPENLLLEIDILLNAAQKIKKINGLEIINFGGGLPIPYREEEEEFDLERFSKLVTNRLKAHLKKGNEKITFYFEPGRWIVGPAGVLLTRVNTVKNQGRKIILGTDTGFNHLLRPVLYDAYHEVVNISADQDAPKQTCDIAGNICESGDMLALNRNFPETKPGDLLAILDAGAYGMTMASCYNRRALPAEILITEKGDNRMIRKRKTAEQTVHDFLRETDSEPVTEKRNSDD